MVAVLSPPPSPVGLSSMGGTAGGHSQRCTKNVLWQFDSLSNLNQAKTNCSTPLKHGNYHLHHAAALRLHNLSKETLSTWNSGSDAVTLVVVLMFSMYVLEVWHNTHHHQVPIVMSLAGRERYSWICNPHLTNLCMGSVNTNYTNTQ